MKPERFTSEQRTFIRSYSKRLESGDAALFAGAGLSRAAGFFDWKGLLQEIAEDLGLDVNREPDLVALAQYHLNHRGSRSRLNDALIESFSRRVKLTPNHYLLARWPIQTIWTTNYDQLIEDAFKEAGKRVDVKIRTQDFALQRARDLILYKMHGDVSQPDLAVLTKDDYERYDKERPLFVEHLKMDLVSKTFLFVGFSFTDPNLEYILSRVRVLLGTNVRQHFAILKEPEGEDAYERRRLNFWKSDLLRFGVDTVSINDYRELETLLAAISMAVNRRNVFVSGSFREIAGDASGLQRKSEDLARLLGRRLIESGYNLISGFGVGIGEQCVLGALRSLYTIDDDARKRVVIRPFPKAAPGEEQFERNTRTRHDLISRAGAVVFIAGSQIDNENARVPSHGVLEEFKIAKDLKRFIIPVAATGHAAEMIWKEVAQNPDVFFPDMDVREHLPRLANRDSSVEELADTILQMVEMTAQARES
jgi:hypothetical protein